MPLGYPDADFYLIASYTLDSLQDLYSYSAIRDVLCALQKLPVRHKAPCRS